MGQGEKLALPGAFGLSRGGLRAQGDGLNRGVGVRDRAYRRSLPRGRVERHRQVADGGEDHGEDVHGAIRIDPDLEFGTPVEENVDRPQGDELPALRIDRLDQDAEIRIQRQEHSRQRARSSCRGT